MKISKIRVIFYGEYDFWGLKRSNFWQDGFSNFHCALSPEFIVCEKKSARKRNFSLFWSDPLKVLEFSPDHFVYWMVPNGENRYFRKCSISEHFRNILQFFRNFLQLFRNLRLGRSILSNRLKRVFSKFQAERSHPRGVKGLSKFRLVSEEQD